MKKVTIVNKFGPASNAITGQNAKEVADYLFDSGIAVEFVCLQAEYVSKQKGETLTLPYSVREVRSVYSGRSPGIRFIASLIDGFRLWVVFRGKKADAVIVMTDPPLLFMWFQIFRIFTSARLIYWTMDLYPEAFVAGNYIRSSNLVYKLFYHFVYRKIPDLTIALGPAQSAYLEEKFKQHLPHVIVPCGIIEKGSSGQEVLPGNKITFGYGGNIGEAHDAEFLITLAKQLDPAKHRMIVSLYGSKASRVKEEIMKFPVVEFRDFLNLNDIAAMDVNVATLLPEWNHICVPSKAVTAICCGTALLLNANTKADNFEMFHEAAWIIESGSSYTNALDTTLLSITPEKISVKKSRAREIANALVNDKRTAYHQIADFIKTI